MTSQPTPGDGAISFDQPVFLRLTRAQRLLDIGKTKMYELIAAGELDAVKMGRATFITRASLEAFVGRLPPFKNRPERGPLA